MAARSTNLRFLGSLVLACLAALVPVAVPRLLPATTSRGTTIGVVLVAEAIVVAAILAVWFTLRAARSRAR